MCAGIIGMYIFVLLTLGVLAVSLDLQFFGWYFGDVIMRRAMQN